MNLRKMFIFTVVAFILGVTGCIVTSFLRYDMHPNLSQTYGIKME